MIRNKILGVGNATLDIVNLVADYPMEDQEVRALKQYVRPGGNVLNQLSVIRQFQLEADWAGTLADDSDSHILTKFLSTRSIGFDSAMRIVQSRTPVSYITVNRKNGSRTIVHYRDIPEYTFESFRKLDLAQYKLIQFEARNVAEQEQMMVYARQLNPDLVISVEVEKAREGVEQLSRHADIIFVSSHFAQQTGLTNISDLCQRLVAGRKSQTLVYTRGELGAEIYRQGEILNLPAYKPRQLVDTIGAGDAFIGAFLGHFVAHHDAAAAGTYAVQISGKKCGQEGLDNLI